MPLECISIELAEALAKAGIHGFEGVAGFLRARDAAGFLRPQDDVLAMVLPSRRLTWPELKPTPESLARFWEQVFGEFAARKTDFKDLRPVWERAFHHGFIPATLPSADGALPLSEIYVTDDPSVGHCLNDGRIVLLSADAASAWSAAGARELELSLSFKTQLSDPACLLDLFPELAAAQVESEVLGTILAVWVGGLEESGGPVRHAATVGMDADGALLIDRLQFDSRGWAEGAELLLRCLARHGVIEDGESLEENLAKILDRWVDEARKAVRGENSLELRLLKAIGGDIKILLGTLPTATHEAVEGHVDPESLARLALAVHGPILLNRLREALELQGLAPPKRGHSFSTLASPSSLPPLSGAAEMQSCRSVAPSTCHLSMTTKRKSSRASTPCSIQALAAVELWSACLLAAARRASLPRLSCV